MTFFERFKDLSTAKDGSPNATAKELKIPSGSISAWKKNGTIPRAGTIKQLVDYFGVSEAYLLGYSNDSTPERKKNSPDKVEADLREILQKVDDKNLPPDKREKLLNVINEIIDGFAN